MIKQYANVASAGMDVHRKFSNVTLRDAQGDVVVREKIKHEDSEDLQCWFSQWPTGLDVVLEASFGWAWLTGVMKEAGLRPRLSNCFKVEKMRQARGWVKTNKKDADQVSVYVSRPHRTRSCSRHGDNAPCRRAQSCRRMNACQPRHPDLIRR